MSDRSNKNSAVSPIIGTILLVAITVVLIAIITAVIMGLADAEDGKKVGMNAQPDNIDTAKAKLILYGGESLSELIKLEMIDHDSPSGEYVLLWEGPAGTVNVGLPYTTEENVARPPEDMKVYDTRINVKGTFTDGREVVLLVQPMTFYDVTADTDSGKIKSNAFVEVPSITGIKKASDEATITITYKNFTSLPEDYLVLYTPEGGTNPITVGGTPTAKSDTNGTYTIKLGTLHQGVKYQVWGVVNSSTDGSIPGELGEFTVSPVSFSYSKNGVKSQSATIYFGTWNVAAHPDIDNIYLCYRAEGSSVVEKVDVYLRYDYGARRDYGADLSGLQSNTKYYVWAEFITPAGYKISGEDDPYPFYTNGVKFKNFNRNAYTAVTMNISFTAVDVGLTTPTKAWVYYQEINKPETVEKVEAYSITPSGESNAGVKAYLTGLKRGTYYTVWGAVELEGCEIIGEEATANYTTLTPKISSLGYRLRGETLDMNVGLVYHDETPQYIIFEYQVDGGDWQTIETSDGRTLVQISGANAGQTYNVKAMMVMSNGDKFGTARDTYYTKTITL